MKQRVKFLTLVLLLIIVASTPLFARSGSIATADDFTAPDLNPAALGFGNAAGFAFLGFYNDAGIEERYRIYFNGESFAFVYGKDGSSNNYRIASSMQPFRNIYFGTDIYWINSEISDAEYGISALWRPHTATSFGVNVKEINRSRPDYILGLGLRPLWWLEEWSNRITITGDFTYISHQAGNDKEYLWDKPTIGIETEVLNGIRLAANYNLEAEVLALNFSLAFRRHKAGFISHYDDNEAGSSGNFYLHSAAKEHRSLASLLSLSKRETVYEFEMKKKIVDEVEQQKIGPFIITKNQITMEELITRIRTLKDDESVDALVIKNPELQTNFANLLELQREFQDFKERDKKIIVYSENYGNIHYALFASIADKLYLNPNGSVVLIGISVAVPYIAETLDKLGIDIVDLRSHDFKTGLNIFTESEMTQAERITYGDLIDDYYLYLTLLIREGRDEKLTLNIEDIIDRGPYLIAQDAVDYGLIDGLIYEEELEGELEHLFNAPHVLKGLPNEKMVYDWSEPQRAKIAVIYASGDIVTGDGSPGRRIGSKTTAKQIRKAREDKSVEGIILQIDSGGGSAYASDLIAREVKLCREAGKPVVVSMGGAAASGGYYIAAYADRIIAEPTTVTGSIGVTGMIPNFNRLFDKIAVRWSSLKRGENADLLAIYRPIEEREIELMKGYIEHTYDQFINVVAEGRGMNYEQVHEIAQGRVWTGLRAKELGLVDEHGGMKEAIEVMKELIGHNEVELSNYSYQPSGLAIGLNFSGTMNRIINPLELPEELDSLMRYKELYDTWPGERALYLLPIFEIKGLE